AYYRSYVVECGLYNIRATFVGIDQPKRARRELRPFRYDTILAQHNCRSNERRREKFPGPGQSIAVIVNWNEQRALGTWLYHQLERRIGDQSQGAVRADKCFDQVESRHIFNDGPS